MQDGGFMRILLDWRQILYENFPDRDKTDSLVQAAFSSNCNDRSAGSSAGSGARPHQDLTFSLGAIPGQTRSFQGSGGSAQISADRSFGINYGHTFLRQTSPLCMVK